MAITLQRITHPSDPVANAMHSAVADVVLQANQVIASSTPKGITNNQIDERAIAAGRALVWTGASFPAGAPPTGTLFFRTDRGILYYYDGTRWLSVQEFSIQAGVYTGLPGTALAATTAPQFAFAIPNGSKATQLFVTSMEATWFVNGGGTALNPGTQDWTFGLADSTGTAFGSFAITTFSTVSAAWENGSSALGGPYTRTINTDIHWRVNLTKTGTPGSIIVPVPTINYRLIG